MIILDTNVTSELMRTRPNAAVVAWLADQDPSELLEHRNRLRFLVERLERLREQSEGLDVARVGLEARL